MRRITSIKLDDVSRLEGMAAAHTVLRVYFDDYTNWRIPITWSDEQAQLAVDGGIGMGMRMMQNALAVLDDTINGLYENIAPGPGTASATDVR